MHEHDTEFATQLARTPLDYLGAPSDIGRAVGDGLRELFVACAPEVALVQQFEHAPQRFIALHDAGCNAARHLLGSVAAATGTAVQRVMIRRTGYGTVLAVVEHVDCHTDNGTVRLYCTDIDADTATRQALAKVLLDHAMLSVVMVGEHPSHVLERLLGEVAVTMDGSAFCHDVLLLALGPPHTLKAHAQAFANATTRTVRLSPRVHDPADAWAPLRAAWNGLQAAHGEGTGPMLPALAMTAPADEVDEPSGLPPPRAAATQAPAHAATALPHALLQLPGVVAACVFDLETSRVLGAAGAGMEAHELARRGTLLLAAGTATRRQLGLDGAAREAVIEGPARSTAVCLLSSIPGGAVHIVFDPVVTAWPRLREAVARPAPGPAPKPAR